MIKRPTFTITDWDHNETELIILGKASWELTMTFTAERFHWWLVVNNHCTDDERWADTWMDKDFDPWIIQRFVAESMLGWFVKISE